MLLFMLIWKSSKFAELTFLQENWLWVMKKVLDNRSSSRAVHFTNMFQHCIRLLNCDFYTGDVCFSVRAEVASLICFAACQSHWYLPVLGATAVPLALLSVQLALKWLLLLGRETTKQKLALSCSSYSHLFLEALSMYGKGLTVVFSCSVAKYKVSEILEPII